MRPYARRTAGNENAWLRKIRQITEDNTIPAQAISLAHVGVSALKVTEKILIKTVRFVGSINPLVILGGKIHTRGGNRLL